MSQDFVYLASGSPRRRELLQQIGVPFRVIETAIDESVLPDETPSEYVARLAAAKAEAGWERNRDDRQVPVLAADTAGGPGGRSFGKPACAPAAEGRPERAPGR